MSDKSLKKGVRVALKDRELQGTIAYVGLTEFAAGKWIGIILDEPKGKNNGTVQGKEYFKCEDNYGMFVRQTQVTVLDEEGGGTPSRPSSRASSASVSSTKDQSPKTETPKRSVPSKMTTPRTTALPKPGSQSGPGSRLPMPGKGPTGSRSPSFTNLKAAKEKKEMTPQSAVKKERSFVEKDFRPTVQQQKPTTTSQEQSPATPSSSSALGSPTVSASPSATMNERIEERVQAAQAQQELLHSKEVIKDLEEKLETLKIKRAKDQEKLKEFEKVKIQHEQLLEFKSRIMDAQSSLQKELQRAKHEAKEAIEAKEKHAEEMSDLSETVEMATLDKEMAEEKAEALQIELDAAKEKIEELTVELDLAKAEMDIDESTEDKITNFEIKQKIAQNEKLRETLAAMRDLLAHEKNVNLKLNKDMEEKNNENTKLSKQNEKLQSQNDELEATISDLQEQVDAALGAEEMVENLTTKCLDMEDKLAAIAEEREDLEKLHELNEELQENAREVEMQLREDLDLAHAKIREVMRARDAAYEIINDHEKTIKNFRDHVKNIQDQNAELRSALEKETNKPVSTPAEMINFKMMFEETKAQSRAIDMELRTCEENQAKQHVQLLSSFMSESFMKRGGDHEAVLMLLLIPRMIWKSEILISQIKENFILTSELNKETLVKGHEVERSTFGNQMLHFLEALLAQLHQFSAALSTCSPETLLKVGALYPEMSVNERFIDFYIDLLRKSQLDENVPIDNLEKCLQYFQNMYPLHLDKEKINHSLFLRSHVKAYLTAAEAMKIEVKIGRMLLKGEDASSEIGTMFKTTEADLDQFKQIGVAMRRRLPHEENVEALLQFPSSSALKMSELTKSLSPIVKAFHIFGKSAAQQAGIQGEAELNATKLRELLHQAVDKVFPFNDAGLETIKSTLSTALKTLTELNHKYQEGEWDIESLPPKPPQPIKLRADQYKAEIKAAEGMKLKLELKEEAIKEMKLALRAKAEEISEMQVRKDKAEKKLIDASQDAELVREKLQRKIDDLQTALKKKDKEFEDTMKHLQREIEDLEGERGELREKIKDITKQNLFKEIHKKATSHPASMVEGGPASLGPSVPMPIRDSPLLKQQLLDLQMALLTMRENVKDKETEILAQKIAKFKPLKVPKPIFQEAKDEKEKSDASKDDMPSVLDLLRRLQDLQREVNAYMVSPSVLDLKRKTYASETLAQLMKQRARQRRLQEEADKIHLEIARLRAARTAGGEVEASFMKFPSPQFSRAFNEKDHCLIGKLRLPEWPDKTCKMRSIPLIVNRSQLEEIHQTVLA